MAIFIFCFWACFCATLGKWASPGPFFDFGLLVRRGWAAGIDRSLPDSFDLGKETFGVGSFLVRTFLFGLIDGLERTIRSVREPPGPNISAVSGSLFK